MSEIRFAYRSDLIWVPVQIEGRSRPLNFLLDTGAEQSVIDLGVAKKLGIRFIGSEVVRRVGGGETAYSTAQLKLRLSGHLSWSAKLLALDLRADSRGVRGKIDGLLGMDFLARRVIQIDYGSKMLRVNPPASTMRGQAIPIRLNRGNPCIAVKIDSAQTLPRVRIDTGCNTALHWSPKAPREEAGSTGQRTIGSFSKATRTVRTDVTLGSTTFRKVGTTRHSLPIFPGEQGLIGNRILERFGVVTLDLANSRLILGNR